MTLLPDGVGGSIVVVPPNADATAAFGTQRRPLNEVFAADGADMDAFAASVEEMLSITIERSQTVTVDELSTVVGDGVALEERRRSAARRRLLGSDGRAGTRSRVMRPSRPSTSSTNRFLRPRSPNSCERLMAGEVQSRALDLTNADRSGEPDRRRRRDRRPARRQPRVRAGVAGSGVDAEHRSVGAHRRPVQRRADRGERRAVRIDVRTDARCDRRDVLLPGQRRVGRHPAGRGRCCCGRP